MCVSLFDKPWEATLIVRNARGYKGQGFHADFSPFSSTLLELLPYARRLQLSCHPSNSVAFLPWGPRSST